MESDEGFRVSLSNPVNMTLSADSTTADGTIRDDDTGVNLEFRVNTFTSDSQTNPSITTLEDGGFVIVWQSNQQDDSGFGIFGQHYDVHGHTVGDEFQINTHTAGDQAYPAVSALSDGGFVVMWESDNQDSSGFGIYGQRYDASNNVAGAEFRINTHVQDDQSYPAVSALSDGGFIATWGSDGQDGDGWSVYAQRFNGLGNTIGDEFRVNSYTISDQVFPSVDALLDGGFVVTWMSNGQDGSWYGIYGQKYDSAGVAVGDEFRINSYTNSDQAWPTVSALQDGGFVVTWTSDGQDGAGFEIYGQKFDSAGSIAGGEFRVNTYLTGDQEWSEVSALSDGGFVVTWMSLAQDGSGFGVYGQKYDASAHMVGREFMVNTYTTDHQAFPDVSALHDGGFIVTWMSNGQDGDGFGIYAQRYDADGNPVSHDVSNSEPTGMVTIDGLVKEGESLMAKTDTLSDPDGLGSFSYHWYADGEVIADATGVSYVLTDMEVGKVITVKVSYTDGHGVTEHVMSLPTDEVYASSYAVDGMVSFWKTETSIEGVDVTLDSAASTETGTTNADGNFSIDSVSGGDYTVAASKAPDESVTKAVGFTDVLAVLKISIGMNPNRDGSGVSSFQYLASDVNHDGMVKADDALSVLRMAVGLHDAPSPEWLFFGADAGDAVMSRSSVTWPADSEITVNKDTVIDLVGVVKGDVDGSWTV
jgi:hypothetical protein